VTTQSVDIARLIQVALAPIFLISAIGVTLNVLTSRLARIVDRAREKVNAHRSKNLILIPARSVVHTLESGRPEGRMHRILLTCLALAAAALGSDGALAAGQMMPGGQGGMGGQGMGRGSGMNQPSEEMPSTPAVEKPDAAAKKAYTAGMKSLNKAKEYAAEAANAQNADKKNSALIKLNDAYGRALDQFTEALSNSGDMVDAWNNVGYIHLRLGAYAESIDDYNHTLALKPDLLEAIEHRAEAYVAIDRLEDAKGAYMELFNHDRPLADQLMQVMQHWLADHRANANGMRVSDVDAFDKWLQERDGIAKQAASLPH